jgi:hypothetical protein
VYLEKLETTMWKMEIREAKLVIVSPLHLEEKWDVYIGSEKSNTTRSNKPGVNNKKMITDNHYDEPLTNNRLWKWHYEELPWIMCMHMVCHILLESSWWWLQLC